MNKNTVTVMGNQTVHRINTGRKDPSHLQWKRDKKDLGYGAVIDGSNWKDVINER